MNPRVSIVMATYRPRPDHLCTALDSALAQTWPAVEIVVGDDSPGGVVAEQVALRRDPRIVHRPHAPALGVAGNHWDAFRAARGEYIAILNHDDWIAPTFVEELVSALMREPAAVVAFCDHWLIDADGRRLDAETVANTRVWGRADLAAGLHQPFMDLVMTQTLPVAMGCVFRKSALPCELPADAGPAYDLWLAYLLARRGAGAVYVPHRLSAWRTHDGNQTSAAGLDWLQGAAGCWQAVAADPAFARQRGDARVRAARAWRACATAALRRGQGRAARSFARSSLAMRWSARGLAALALAWMPSRMALSALESHSASRRR